MIHAIERDPMDAREPSMLAKVPHVTFGFWLIKIAATTLGETGGDAVTMSMNLGYLVGTAIFATIFIAFVIAQIVAQKFHPYLYWATIIATTTGGTTILLSLLLLSLFAWHRTLGTISVESVGDPKSELFYWVTIMFSQTLGTALGDWVADGRSEVPAGLGLGYSGAAAVFGGLILVVAVLYFFTTISHVAMFWAAFILTRPLGAALGDLLDKPLSHG